MIFNQFEFDLRCEWGEQGVAKLTPISDVVIINQLSFNLLFSFFLADRPSL
jgi:2-phosphosulfolactate phosphatase